ncbi:MAG: YtxH domain-containing protein [Actinomycetota bacterium]|nr:YtxH domain-containing protein [Actinomycetota bacterium]
MSHNNQQGNSGAVFTGFLLGVVAGAIAAMLLTPKSGKELRSDIKKVAADIKKEAEHKASQVKDLTQKKYEHIVNSTIAGYEKVKELTQKEIEAIKHLIYGQKETE